MQIGQLFCRKWIQHRVAHMSNSYLYRILGEHIENILAFEHVKLEKDKFGRRNKFPPSAGNKLNTNIYYASPKIVEIL